MDRQNYENWVNAGSKSIVETTREKVEKILNNESSWILPQEIQKKIRNIRERAEDSAR
jgi:trimethylamine:corrinoid methyltransferase-like protein